MFETLGDRLAAVLKKITGRGVLRPEDVDASLREVRLALLEALLKARASAPAARNRESHIAFGMQDGATPWLFNL